MLVSLSLPRACGRCDGKGADSPCKSAGKRGSIGRQVGASVAWRLKQESNMGTGDCRLRSISSHNGRDPDSFLMKRFLLQSYSSPKWWQTRGRQVEDVFPARLLPEPPVREIPRSSGDRVGRDPWGRGSAASAGGEAEEEEEGGCEQGRAARSLHLCPVSQPAGSGRAREAGGTCLAKRASLPRSGPAGGCQPCGTARLPRWGHWGRRCPLPGTSCLAGASARRARGGRCC